MRSLRAGLTAHWPLAATVLAAVLVTIQKGVIAGHPGNYLLFRYSFHRLVSGADLYSPPPGEMTGFLYSPTFALLFGPFAVGPVWFGLLLWNGVNALALYAGLTRLVPSRAARLALAIVFLDLVRSLQNSQSNALVAGLLLLAFAGLERRREAAAAAAVVIAACIKIFPLAAGVAGLLAPGRRRFLLWSLILAAVAAALPVLVISPTELMRVYREWLAILQRDSGLQGQSVMRIASDWFHLQLPNWTVQLAGTLALLAPLAGRRAAWEDPAFRLRWLSSLLVFLVIFNHQAESASFVIATSGIALWYVTAPRTAWRTALVLLTLLVESAPHLFLVPYSVSHDVIGAHAIDVAPCLLIWCVIQAELWRWRAHRD